jgi:hypothetical protein
MKEFDEFSSRLLEESKRFLEKAIQDKTKEGEEAYLHSSLVLGFAALEAYVNGIADELLVDAGTPVMDRGILSEREVGLVDGQFRVLPDRLKIYRLEDRIQFLYRKYTKRAVDKNTEWWKEILSGIHLRNQLVHPKDLPSLSSKKMEQILKAIVKTIDVLFHAVYKEGFPIAGKGINSSMTF